MSSLSRNIKNIKKTRVFQKIIKETRVFQKVKSDLTAEFICFLKEFIPKNDYGARIHQDLGEFMSYATKKDIIYLKKHKAKMPARLKQYFNWLETTEKPEDKHTNAKTTGFFKSEQYFGRKGRK